MTQPLTIAMYHYVRRIKQSRYPDIKGLELDSFISQLEFFKKNYNVVTMEEVLAATYQEAKLPSKAILLTFDDAYAEHFTHVYPILKSFDMQGSFYVPAKTVLEHKVLDVNKIHFILASVGNINELLESLRSEIKDRRAEYSLLTYEQYIDKFAVANRFDTKEVIFVKRMLQHALPESLRGEITDSLFKQFVSANEEAFCRELYMNEYQIKQLINDGMHVGCHGYDHYWWNKLESEKLNKEIDLSKDFLVRVGADLDQWTACYPYGSSSEQVVKVLREKGCKLAFTTEVRVANLSSDEPLLIPRLDTNDLPKGRDDSTNSWYENA